MYTKQDRICISMSKDAHVHTGVRTRLSTRTHTHTYTSIYTHTNWNTHAPWFDFQTCGINCDLSIIYELVLIYCIFLGVSHTSSKSRFDPDLSRMMYYVEAHWDNCCVWLSTFTSQKKHDKSIYYTFWHFFGGGFPPWNWLKMFSSQRSVVLSFFLGWRTPNFLTTGLIRGWCALN